MHPGDPDDQGRLWSGDDLPMGFIPDMDSKRNLGPRWGTRRAVPLRHLWRDDDPLDLPFLEAGVAASAAAAAWVRQVTAEYERRREQ